MVTTMAEMVVSGVSTRKVARVVETLCGTSVSDVCKDLDQEVEAFRNRPIEGNYPFLTVDATYTVPDPLIYLRLENSCRDSIQVHLFPKKYCNLGEKLYFPPIFL